MGADDELAVGPVHASFAFLPGASGRGEFWDPVREELRSLGVVEDALVVDWPGFGGVAADPSLQCYDDLASLVIARLRGPTVLVAQSMGGVVAVLVAKRRPDLVRALVLAVTSGGVDVERFGAADWRPGSRAANPGNPPWMWDERLDLTDTLAALPMKVLLVWATDDGISPLAIGRHLEQLVPRARLRAYESDDHWVARLNASAVAGEIAELLTPSVGFLHTAQEHVATFDALLPSDVSRTHVVEPELLAQAREGLDVSEGVASALHALRIADVVVCTCSTVGALAEAHDRPDRHVLRVDRPMAAEAVRVGGRVAIVAALASTIAPTRALLLDECERQDRRPELLDAPCLDAWAHWEAGDVGTYHRAIAAHVDALDADVDTVVLAQASMAGAAALLAFGPGRRVLSSPSSAVAAALAAVTAPRVSPS